ncbi:MAG: copper resistance CopC/CopD family protein [Actinomycetota bacterium]
MRRLAFGALLALVLAGAWSAAVAPAASGHAAIEQTEPGNGELLDAAPERIRLSFTEAPDLSLTTIALVDASGATVETGPVEAAPDRGAAVVVEGLADGVYTVSWRTVSTVDGHVTSGAFTFGVGVAAAEVAPVREDERDRTPPPTAPAVAGRWGLYVGLAVLLGGALAGLLWLPADAVARPRLLGAAWTLAALGVVVMTLEERAAVGVPLGTLLGSESGGAFVRLGVAVAVAGLGALAAALRPGRPALLALASTAGAAVAVRATGGHAGPSTVEVLLQAVHVAAVAAWIGGLGWLVVGVRRGIEPARVRGYSNVAAAGLLILLVTGMLRATDELGGAGRLLHLFDSDYGTTLAVKLAVVVALVILGARNRFRNVRRFEERGRGPLLRTVGAELALAAAVFGATAVLTGLPPREASGSTAPRQPEPLVVTGSDFATTTRVRLEVAPGTVGPNAFAAEVTDYDTAEPVDARRVTLAFALPGRPEVGSELELTRAADGTWQAGGTALSIDGAWTVTVLVEGNAGSVEVPLEVTPRRAEQRVEVSRAEGQPDLYTIEQGGGVELQAYVDPGVAGRTNQAHVTVFDAEGAELPLADATVTITPPEGDAFEPALLRGGVGHFVANVDLTRGTWRFEIAATTRDGAVLTASFEQTFET